MTTVTMYLEYAAVYELLGEVPEIINGALQYIDDWGYACPSGGIVSGTNCFITSGLESGAVSSPPVLVTAVSGTTSTMVSWTAPSYLGGSVISTYQVTASDITHIPNGGQTCTTAATSCTFSTLTNGDTYTFTVTATNANGVSQPSFPSNSVTPLSPPSVPTNVVATPSTTTITVSWTASTYNGGSPITGYVVTSTPGSFQCTTTGATSCSVSGLTPGTYYDFQVQAQNIAGLSASSVATPAIGLYVTNAIYGYYYLNVAPTEEVLNPTGTFAYIANSATGTIEVFSTVTNSPAGSINTQGALAIAINPSGTYLYATGYGVVTVISTATNAVVATIPVSPNSWGIAVSPSGSYVYVTFNTFQSQQISVISTATNSVIGTINGFAQNNQIVINPSGTDAWTSNVMYGILTEISLTTGQAILNYNIGTSTNDLVMNAAGTYLYLTSQYSNEVLVFSTITDSLVSTILVGTGPLGLSLNPSGTYLYVTNGTSNTISVISTFTNAVVATISSIGGDPVGVVVGSNGMTAYVINNAGDAVAYVYVGVFAPSAPTAVSATSGQATVPVSWTAPSNNGGVPVVSYTVTANDATRFANGGQTCTSTGTTCTVTGLTLGDSYNFTVSAYNGVGYSSPSIASNAVTPVATVPSFPSNLSALQTGITSMTAAWSAPSYTGGLSVTQYTVTASDSTHSSNAPVTCSSTNTSCVLAGLSNGDSYSVTVTATNGVGTSVASPIVNTTLVPIDSEITTLSTGSALGGFALSPSGALAYIGSTSTNTISVVSTQSLAIQTTLTISGINSGIIQLAVDPTGTILFALGYRYVYEISLPSGTLIGSSYIGSSTTGMVLSPSGTSLYVSAGQAVYQIATATMNEVSYIGLANSGQIAITPNGAYLYVQNINTGVMSVVATSSNQVVASIQTFPSSGPMVMNATGTQLYVSDPIADLVQIISTSTNSVVGGINVGVYIFGLALNAPGTQLFVATWTSSQPIFSTSTFAQIGSVNIPQAANYVAVGTSGVDAFYFTYSGNLLVPAFVGNTTPSVPLSVQAGAGGTSVPVIWNVPSSYGGTVITSYTVTAVDSTHSNHGGETCVSAVTSCVVSGLTIGDTYTFSVVATNAVGNSSPSGPSNAVTTVANPSSQTFSYTGSVQTFTVPTGQTWLNVTAYGAAGGNSVYAGGLGGEVIYTLSVTPGTTISIVVGAAGVANLTSSGVAGSFGGGGGAYSAGGAYQNASDYDGGGGGGGATSLTLGGVLTLVAGGGGGGSGDLAGSAGGAGGGSMGGWGGNYGGGGGSQSSGGSGYIGSGTLGQGGLGFYGSGGGGGGYYGGGGGGNYYPSYYYGGGGGGSSLVPSSGFTTSGVNAGNGSVVISW